MLEFHVFGLAPAVIEELLLFQILYLIFPYGELFLVERSALSRTVGR